MKLRQVVAGSLAALALTAPLAVAAPGGGGPAGKSVVCHTTSSAKNPVVMIKISNKAVAHHKAQHDDAQYEYAYGACLAPGWDAL